MPCQQPLLPLTFSLRDGRLTGEGTGDGVSF
jgi:hypothetical protein